MRQQGNPTSDTAERAFASFIAAACVVSSVALVAAALGLFGRVALAAVAAPAGMAAAVWTWRDSGADGIASSRWDDWALVALVILGGALLLRHPGEYLFDGNDGSVYLNIGRIIAQTGAIHVPDAILDLVPSGHRADLLSRDAYPPHLYNLFRGGIQIAADRDVVVPNFFHLYPVWIATFAMALGPKGGLYVNPVCAVVGVVALWILGRRAGGRLAGGTAAILLLVNFGQVWFGRFPTAEPMGQAFTLGALALAAIWLDHPTRALGFWAGFAFGLAGCVRIDLLVLVTPFGLLVPFLARTVAPSGALRAFLMGLTASATLAVAHACLITTPYVLRVFMHMRRNSIGGRTLIVPALVLFVLSAAAVTAWWLARRRERSHAPESRKAPDPTRVVTRLDIVMVAVAGAIGYAAARRGLLFPFSHLLTMGGIAAAAGGAIVLLRARTPTRILVLALVMPSAALYVQSARDVSDMPMLFRRYVPVVLPLALLSVGLLTTFCWSLLRHARAAALLIPMAIGSASVTYSWPLVIDPPMQGVYDSVARLSAALERPNLVVLDRPMPSHLGQTLHFAFGNTVLQIAVDRVGTRGRTNQAIAAALGSRRLAYVIRDASSDEGGALARVDRRAFGVEQAGTLTLRAREVAPSRTARRGAVVDVVHPLEIYRVRSLADPRARVNAPFAIDVGDSDSAYIVDGFHQRERIFGESARWTNGAGRLAVPPIRLDSPGERQMRLQVAALRSPDVQPGTLAVEIDGQRVAEVAVSNEFASYRVTLPPWAIQHLRQGSIVALRSGTFVPARSGGGDQRTLGVAVDRVDIR